MGRRSPALAATVAIALVGTVLAAGVLTGGAASATAAQPTGFAFDTGFAQSLGAGPDGTVRVIAVSPVDGATLIAGAFTSVDGVASLGLALLAPDGQVDPSFSAAAGTGFDGSIRDAAPLSDGRWAIAGSFSSFDGTPVHAIAVLEADGTLDSSFTANGGAGLNSGAVIRDIAVDSRDRIVLCGDPFLTFDGAPVLTVARILPDGELDRSFAPTAGASYDPTSGPSAVAVDDQDDIVVGGGISVSGVDDAAKPVRLDDAGAADTTFSANAGSGIPGGANAAAIDHVTGDVGFTGAFRRADGAPTLGVARFDRDGHLDTAFMAGVASGPDGMTVGVAFDHEGGLIALGLGITVRDARDADVVRYLPEGRIDQTFYDDLAARTDDRPRSVAVDPSGAILVGGAFTTWGGRPTGHLVRIVPTVVRPTATPTPTPSPTATSTSGGPLVSGAGEQRRLAATGVEATTSWSIALLAAIAGLTGVATLVGVARRAKRTTRTS